MNGVPTNSAVINSGDYNSIGANQGLYIGTVKTVENATTPILGGLEDSAGAIQSLVGGNRLVWNYYNQVRKHIGVTDGSAASWTYNSTTWRAKNNNINNRVNFIIGLSSYLVEANNLGVASVNNGPKGVISIGLDSITVPSSQMFQTAYNSPVATANIGISSMYKAFVDLGFHFLQELEAAPVGTVAFVGTDGSTPIVTLGLLATIPM